MKITSFATLAALAFTSSLSADPFEMREVDISQAKDLLPLKVKAREALMKEFEESGLKVGGLTCEVGFTEFHNQTDEYIKFGPFTIPPKGNRLFVTGLRKVIHGEEINTTIKSYPLEASVPIFIPELFNSTASSFTAVNYKVVLSKASTSSILLMAAKDKDLQSIVHHLGCSYDIPSN